MVRDPLDRCSGGGISHAHRSNQGDLTDPFTTKAIRGLHHCARLQGRFRVFITDPDPGLAAIAHEG